MASRIQIAKPDILKAFEGLPRVLTERDITNTLNTNRSFWRLAKRTTLTDFKQFMLDETPLRRVHFDFPQRSLSGFTWGEVPLLEVLLGIVENSFLSHYTAIQIHGLTEQSPKTIFLNQEKSNPYQETNQGPFEQEAIDKAFSQPPRFSQNEVTHGSMRILFLKSAYQAGLGITMSTMNFGGRQDLTLRYTNLERTLIDAAVRPFYAGGVFEVAKAFENSRHQNVSVNTLASMLKRMKFGYPYHQAIGYYLQRANYKSSQIDLFRKMPMDRDFYLTHQMGETSYNKEWRLHVPKGF